MSVQLLYTAAAGFEAARMLDAQNDARVRKLHGHSFKCSVRAGLSNDWEQFAGSAVGQLAEALSCAVAPLDYSDLNQVIAQPTDAALAQWISEQLGVPQQEQIRLSGAPNQGVILQAQSTQVWRQYALQSAHWLPNVPPGHKCGRLHGHGFTVVLQARQNASNNIDYGTLDAIWAPLHERLNHVCLNDIPGLENPTSEMLSAWIWAQIKPALPGLSRVTVYETASCAAHFDGTHYRIWKDFTIDSAVRLQHAPQQDARRYAHGHTFTLRLHLQAPLDHVMGWTVDYGQVKDVFNPLFKELDHQPLHERFPETDTASIAHQIRELAAPLIPELARIDLYETAGTGVILDWSGQAPELWV